MADDLRFGPCPDCGEPICECKRKTDDLRLRVAKRLCGRYWSFTDKSEAAELWWKSRDEYEQRRWLDLATAILPLIEDGCGCWHCGEETDPNCACQRRLQAREKFLGPDVV